MNPSGTIALDETVSLAFITKDDDHLYLRLSWQEGENSTSSLTMGSGVAPQKEFIYFWDDHKKTLWFADSEILYKIELTGAAQRSTKSTSRTTKSYRCYDDMPKEVPPLLQSLIK